MKIWIVLSLFDQRLKFVHVFECDVDLSNPYHVPFSFFGPRCMFSLNYDIGEIGIHMLDATYILMPFLTRYHIQIHATKQTPHVLF